MGDPAADAALIILIDERGSLASVRAATIPSSSSLLRRANSISQGFSVAGVM